MGCLQSKKSHADKLGNEDSELLTSLTNFSPEELEKCYRSFNEESESGKMNKKQFDEHYNKLFSNDTEKKFSNHLFRIFDFNGDGYINFKEFVCGLSVVTRGTADERLMWTFNVYDVNKDGTITRDEMLEIMRSIYAINGVSEPEQLKFGDEAFEGLDDNKDGLITVAEFIKGVRRDKRLLEMLERTTSIND